MVQKMHSGSTIICNGGFWQLAGAPKYHQAHLATPEELVISAVGHLAHSSLQVIWRQYPADRSNAGMSNPEVRRLKGRSCRQVDVEKVNNTGDRRCGRYMMHNIEVQKVDIGRLQFPIPKI